MIKQQVNWIATILFLRMLHSTAKISGITFIYHLSLTSNNYLIAIKQ